MRAVTLATLRQRLRWRCDIENETTRFPDAELNDALNEGIAKFHSRIVRTRAENMFEATASVTTSQAVELYALPATFLQVLKVYTTIDGVEIDLLPYDTLETDGYTDSISWTSMQARPKFKLRGANISFRPIPDAAYVVTLVYVPTAVVLTADGQSVDGVDGLEEYIVAWAGKRVAMKQKDTTLAALFDGEMARAFEEVDGLIHGRDAVSPPKMQDVRRLNSPTRWRRRWMR